MAEKLEISIDYDQLNKYQKLAIFMIVVGVPAAAEILKEFDDHEVELICQEIANYPLIDQKNRNRVIEEFAGIIGEGSLANLGGSNYALKTLEKAKGDYKAANIIGRIAPATSAMEVLNEISEMEPRQIYNLIRHEQPQTVAFILSHLSEEKAALILTMLPAELRASLTIQPIVVPGDPTEELLYQASAQQADLIVLGAHGASAFASITRQGVVYKVLAHAECPVMTLSPVMLANCGAPGEYTHPAEAFLAGVF